MTKRMLIDALHPEETRIVIADENRVYDFDFVSTAKKQLKGNIYLAKITRVEPSLQAAFVEYGGGKQGFLPFSEIHADYYQIPASDRKRLMEEAEQDDSPEQPDQPESFEPSESSVDDQNPSQDYNESDAGQQEGEPAANLALPALPDAIETNPEGEPIGEESASEEIPTYMSQSASDISIASEPVEPADNNAYAEPQLELPVENTESATEIKSNSAPVGEESGAPENVETLRNEDEEIQSSRPKKNVFSRRYKIQEVIRRGQVVLVQVIKEERGNKGASLTTYLSLAGRYCVLMPNSPKDGGISRKIASVDDRKRLKAISTELRLSKGMSVIIRTAGMDRTRAEIKRDYDYLVKVWNRIREDTLKSTAPALIYEESDIIKRAIRDQYTNDIDELWIEGSEANHAAKEFMKLLLPSHTPKIKHYQESTPLFYAYNVEDQLLSMHDPVVKLKSGGYIVINPTEALISIDVNSGRSTGERNIEETASKTNLEAAMEVARQLRLRDLAGLIVIDFIDMLESRNRRAVEKALKDALKMDRAKIQLGRISPFGLLEMSRQRLRPSISETNMVQCPHCTGRGYVRSNDSMSIQLIRALEKEASTGNWSSLRLVVPQSVALHLLNQKRDSFTSIEQRHTITIQVVIDNDLTASEFNVEKMRRGQGERSQPANDARRERGGRRNHNDRPRQQDSASEEAADNITDIPEEAMDSDTISTSGENEPSNNDARRDRGNRRRGGRNRRPRNNFDRNNEAAPQNDAPSVEIVGGTDELPVNNEAVPTTGNNDNNRPRRSRGGRGRRKWRDRNGEERPVNERSERTPEGHSANYVQTTHSTELPAFATEAPIPLNPPKPEATAPVLESTPRDPNAPSKKGWWQKMIELD